MVAAQAALLMRERRRRAHNLAIKAEIARLRGQLDQLRLLQTSPMEACATPLDIPPPSSSLSLMHQSLDGPSLFYSLPLLSQSLDAPFVFSSLPLKFSPSMPLPLLFSPVNPSVLQCPPSSSFLSR